MTDRALTNAQKRRDDIAAKINQLVQEVEIARRELAAAEAFIKEWYRFADPSDDTEDNTQKNSSYPQGHVADVIFPPTITQTPKNPERAEVGKHAAQIITELGRPIPRQKLFKELWSRGVEIYGKDPEMVLSTMMWRMREQFIRLPRVGYWLRDKPYEPAKYIPGAPGNDPQAYDADIFQSAEREEQGDTLSELARLIGQKDPFGSKK